MERVAWITGASRGIGAAIATKFAKEGYHLSLCCSKTKDKLDELATGLQNQYGIKVETFVGDISKEAFVQEMLEKTLEVFGRIDVLVNNAGICHIGLLSDMSFAEWNRIVSVNLSSAFLTSKAVIPNMLYRKEGKILNISSVWGNVGASCEVAYSACKGGINSFTKSLGKELAPSNIQVNAIACGMIDTEMNACFTEEEKQELMEEIPAGRFAMPEEVANLAFQICTENSYLTGQIIVLDGGWI